MELLVARNPDPDSTLPYLLRVPLGAGLVFRTKGTWPRTAALYCHPVPAGDWPKEPELVERVPLRSCARRGAAIDVVADRGREARSQIVFTSARGREVVFWQSPRTSKQARPHVRLPTARAAGVGNLEVLVDAHERYPYTFAGQQVRTVRRALSCGDYAVTLDGRVVAAVERKSLPDPVSSLTSGRLRHALAELAALPRAAVVVEDRYSQVFTFEHVRSALVADGLAELQVRWPSIPLVFCETRKLAEEWTYRYLAAASTWARYEQHAVTRIHRPDATDPAPPTTGLPALPALDGPALPAPTTAEVRAWARAAGPPGPRPRTAPPRDPHCLARRPPGPVRPLHGLRESGRRGHCRRGLGPARPGSSNRPCAPTSRARSRPGHRSASPERPAPPRSQLCHCAAACPAYAHAEIRSPEVGGGAWAKARSSPTSGGPTVATRFCSCSSRRGRGAAPAT